MSAAASFKNYRGRDPHCPPNLEFRDSASEFHPHRGTLDTEFLHYWTPDRGRKAIANPGPGRAVASLHAGLQGPGHRSAPPDVDNPQPLPRIIAESGASCRPLDDISYVEHQGAAGRDQERLAQADLLVQFRGNPEWQDQQAEELEGATDAVAAHRTKGPGNGTRTKGNGPRRDADGADQGGSEWTRSATIGLYLRLPTSHSPSPIGPMAADLIRLDPPHPRPSAAHSVPVISPKDYHFLGLSLTSPTSVACPALTSTGIPFLQPRGDVADLRLPDHQLLRAGRHPRDLECPVFPGHREEGMVEHHDVSLHPWMDVARHTDRRALGDELQLDLAVGGRIWLKPALVKTASRTLWLTGSLDFRRRPWSCIIGVM